MNYYYVLTIVFAVATLISVTLIAEAFQYKVRAKLFVCLYLFLALHWIDSSVAMVFKAFNKQCGATQRHQNQD